MLPWCLKWSLWLALKKRTNGCYRCAGNLTLGHFKDYVLFVCIIWTLFFKQWNLAVIFFLILVTRVLFFVHKCMTLNPYKLWKNNCFSVSKLQSTYKYKNLYFQMMWFWQNQQLSRCFEQKKTTVAMTT